MNKKFILLASILSLVLGIGLIKNSITRATRVPQAPTEANTLAWYAEQAQAAGANAYNFGSARVEYDEPETWDDVLANYTVVTAQLVSSQSYATFMDRDIQTWYKFRINETLSQKPIISCDGCPPFPTAPPEMLPLQANEMLVAKPGGSLSYNGIFLTSQNPEFPDFLPSETYMFVMQLDTASQVGKLSIGPSGAYSVDANSIMHPTNPILNVYEADLSSRYGMSLNQMRAVLNPPPPSSCDPVQQQNCLDADGTWNSTTCHCTPYQDYCTHKPWLCE
ncbi:MAG TPA: hypothetical protein VHQ64_15485 [Pyrinomonadaceae bacterium]|jgi:hypothetical protein|nr:hypothetical protein [Pyrinomonadaceae bacterium]